MKLFKCGTCDKILEEKYASNHPASKITWLDATEHEERKKEIDEMQENSNEENKEKKVNDLATLKAKLHDLEEKMKDVDDPELNDLLQSVKAQLEELEKINPETDEEAKKSKSAMAEFIGIDNNYHSVSIDGDIETESLVAQQSHRHRQKKLKHSQSYSVLTLDQGHNTAPGDKLLYLLGSRDDDSVDDSSGDELLKSLGSSD